MKPQDQAFLTLLGIALLFAAAVFRGRRKRGKSRAMATFAAGIAAGALLSLAFMLMYDRFTTPHASIGLERIVGPIVTMFASTVASALLAGIVHLFASRDPTTQLAPLSSDADAILRWAAQSGATRPVRDDDWRAFARLVAATPKHPSR